jgi:hypothetical protein
VAVALLSAALVLIDSLVGRHQERILEERKEAQARLEKMARFYLRADVDDITLTPDNKYKVTVWIENVFPEYDFYLMVPTLRGFIQVGPQWQEVKTVEATTDPGLREGTVVNLKDKIKVSWVIDIQTKDYFELLPGYMHVQVNNNMFVSPQAEPEEGESIVERNDYYYVHLKPIGADDEYIRRVNNFPAGAPLYIPMPPH